MKIKLINALMLGLVVAVSAPALAQEWPTKPVKLLVGSSPGGGTDAMARAVADKLTPMWGQTVVVENKPGASNTLAADLTAKSTDGQTMLMGVSTAQAIAPHLLKLNYNNEKDLIPVAFTGSVPNVLVVAANSPVNSVQDLVKLLKSKPGQLNFASSGAGSTQHIAAELFKDLAGVNAVHVPYKGSGPAMIDLIAGQVQYAFETMSSALPQIRGGKLKALGVASDARNPQLPDTPTMKEAGVPLVMSAWYGVYMPANTPAAVINKVNADVNKVLNMPDTTKRLETIGATIQPMSQTQFKAFHDAENKRYADVIKKNNIQVN
ncbi:tripartite tricarboxylate transporter substrate binding protein [Zwartia sp.]|uniref:Bug family tripartite tricarboxylate transporter substrate binding protein n=1 Tax=Zwartia sp. TaxID=2978004 RepID=UPI002721C6A7|nr:tripartite tricarboxylate transporter substrate binding protein [Zwartia sp.]MDO9025714.1 tripartite tricarboxylate transporter substrate binding protein [Zwartia sp.]